MTTPDREKIGVFAVLTEIEIVEKIAFHEGGVAEGGELKISGISFGRREQVVFGFLGNMAIGDDKKSNWKEPEEMGNDKGKKGGD